MIERELAVRHNPDNLNCVQVVVESNLWNILCPFHSRAIDNIFSVREGGAPESCYTFESIFFAVMGYYLQVYGPILPALSRAASQVKYSDSGLRANSDACRMQGCRYCGYIREIRVRTCNPGDRAAAVPSLTFIYMHDCPLYFSICTLTSGLPLCRLDKAAVASKPHHSSEGKENTTHAHTTQEAKKKQCPRSEEVTTHVKRPNSLLLSTFPLPLSPLLYHLCADSHKKNCMPDDPQCSIGLGMRCGLPLSVSRTLKLWSSHRPNPATGGAVTSSPQLSAVSTHRSEA